MHTLTLRSTNTLQAHRELRMPRRIKPPRLRDSTDKADTNSHFGGCQLGEDEIIVILNYLYLAEYHDMALLRRHFAQYSLISRNWRPHAQVLLFRCIEPNTSLISRTTEHLVRPTDFKLLLLRVRILSLSYSQFIVQHQYNKNAGAYKYLCHMMSLFPFLYELRLCWGSIAPTVEDTEALVRTPRILALRLTVVAPLVSVILPLVQAWPIRHLFLTIKLMASTTADELDILWSTIPSLQLEELGLDIPRFAPMHPVVEWLLQYSSKSLRVLHLDGAHSFVQSKSHPLLSHLHSLTLTNYNLLQELTDMKSLVELTIFVDEKIWAATSIQRCFQQLPLSLQYLRIIFFPEKEYHYWEEDTKRFLRFIRSLIIRGERRWDLRRLTLQGPSNIPLTQWCPNEDTLAEYHLQFSSLGVQLMFEQESPRVRVTSTIQRKVLMLRV